jgi:hypothetical protein
MRNQEVKNKPQQSEHQKNDRKNKQEIAAAYAILQPNAQQNTGFHPQGNRYIRSWVEGTPDGGK